ncbi:cell growth regulator with RING finger domain protein 1 [Brachyistius frenatus]|uniref:cell growth regulator with RING finger domain protein 1 n=1 Tax=Brachyistius frenatus TaxID=100188 RepID=UPI0037E822D3
MAAVFLVTLYEYSPLFYITVVSLCFVVTAAMVLGWFGFDVPVILRSSDEAESVTPTPEKMMVQVTNPFSLELGARPAGVTDGVSLRTCCLEPCVLSCFWGCEVGALQGALQAHQHGPRLSTAQHFLEALHLHYLHQQSFQISGDDREERLTQIPAARGVADFGPLPRERYPLVAVLTAAKATNMFNIVASVSVLHVPDDRYRLSARVLFQYLLTSEGSMYELKPLFMSADGGGTSGPPDSQQGFLSREDSSSEQRPGLDEQRPGLDEQRPDLDEDWSEGTDRDCVVCQNAVVNRVLLPCRHACVCDSCVDRFQHCPICRAFILESFTLTQRQSPDSAAEP